MINGPTTVLARSSFKVPGSVRIRVSVIDKASVIGRVSVIYLQGSYFIYYANHKKDMSCKFCSVVEHKT